MLHTTFALAHRFVCETRYRQAGRAFGGIKNHGRNTPTPLTKVLEVLGLSDALFCLMFCVEEEEAKRISRLVACDFADSVLWVFEKECPNNIRPHKAIEAAHQYVKGKIGRGSLKTLRDATWRLPAMVQDYPNDNFYAARAAADAAWYTGGEPAANATATAAAARRAIYLAQSGSGVEKETSWQTTRFLEYLRGEA